ncbi:MAG: methyltransferase domain-containing protein [Alphaproteobacteria bacterium]|nr:methyltransferase domain-containing protein [Alphaproteobacteria bacterium]
MGKQDTEVAENYEAIADWFDRNRDKTLFEREYLSNILARMPKDEGTLFDLGCGTGEPIARFFIENGVKVTGVDAAPRMVEYCRARFPAHEWRVGDMRGLELGRKFGAVLAWDSFFHLTQEAQRGMFAVFARHAAPGAPLAFNTGTEAGEVYGTMDGRDFHHASLATDEYRELLNAHGFDVVTHKADDADCGGRTVWLAQKRG